MVPIFSVKKPACIFFVVVAVDAMSWKYFQSLRKKTSKQQE